jgi:hypothetical protein
MPIYAAEANGIPFVVFEAADEAAARKYLDNPMLQIELSTRNDASTGKLVWAGVTPLVIRPATATEQEKRKTAIVSPGTVVFLIETTMAPTRPGLTPFTSPEK